MATADFDSLAVNLSLSPKGIGSIELIFFSNFALQPFSYHIVSWKKRHDVITVYGVFPTRALKDFEV